VHPFIFCKSSAANAFRPVFRQFVLLCKLLDLFGRELLAVAGRRIKAVNNKDCIGVSAVMTMPSAVIMKAMTVWLRRSMRRSERRPYQIMLTAPTANDTAVTKPVECRAPGAGAGRRAGGPPGSRRALSVPNRDRRVHPLPVEADPEALCETGLRHGRAMTTPVRVYEAASLRPRFPRCIGGSGRSTVPR
jgi:hypothetical protein